MTNTITEDQVLAALGTVNDPDLHKDLVSLGFIENIEIKGNNVAFTVMLTTPACPLKDKIRMDCLEALRRDIPGIENIELTFGSRMRSDSRLTGNQNFPFRNVIAVGAGKGGVGKSTVAVNLAVSLAESGASIGLLDADIYGPNIPSMLGIDESPRQDGQMILPIEKYGLKLMSMGFLIPRGSGTCLARTHDTQCHKSTAFPGGLGRFLFSGLSCGGLAARDGGCPDEPCPADSAYRSSGCYHTAEGFRQRYTPGY